MNEKLIVFDWDGTLADSIEQIAACKKVLAFEYGLPAPSYELVKSVLGLEFSVALAKSFPTASQKQLDEIAIKFHAAMKRRSTSVKLFPHAKQTLKQLKQQGYLLAVATSKHREEFVEELTATGIEKYFEVTCCGNEYAGKPNPEMLFCIMEMLNVANTNVVMVGDTIFDAKFARNANVKFIGVSYGAHDRLKLMEFEPLAIIDCPEELQEVLQSSTLIT